MQDLNRRDFLGAGLGAMISDYESRATLDWSKWLPAEK